MSLNLTSNYYSEHVQYFLSSSMTFQNFWRNLFLYIVITYILWFCAKKLYKLYNSDYHESRENTTVSNLKYTVEQHHDISTVLNINRNGHNSKFETYILWLAGAIEIVSKENLIILSIRNDNANLISTSCIEICDIDFSEYFTSKIIHMFLKWLEWLSIIPIFWRFQVGIVWIPPFIRFSGTYYHIDVNENESSEISNTIQDYVFRMHPDLLMIIDVQEPNDKSKHITINNNREIILPWFRATKGIFPDSVTSLDAYISTVCTKQRRKNIRAYRKNFAEGGGRIRCLHPSVQKDFDEIQVRMKELCALKLETDMRYRDEVELYKTTFDEEWMLSLMHTDRLLNKNQMIFMVAEENDNPNLLGFSLMFIRSGLNETVGHTIGIHDTEHARKLRVYQNLILFFTDWSLRNGYHVIDYGSEKEKVKALLIQKKIRLCSDEHTRSTAKCILGSVNPFHRLIMGQIKHYITEKACKGDSNNLEHTT